MKFFINAFCLFLFFFLNLLIAQEKYPNSSLPVEYASNDIIVYIKPQKAIYSLKERIIVKVCIENRSKSFQSFSFNLHKNLYFNFELHAKLNVSSANYTFDYLAWKHYNLMSERDTIKNKQKPKVVSLDYGESFNIALPLSDFFNFQTPGRYFVKGNFIFNESIHQFSLPVQEFVIHIEKESTKDALNLENIHSELENHQHKQSFSKNEEHTLPTDIVKKYLDSEIERNWENYFETIHLPSYLENSYNTTEIYERYQSATSRQKDIILSEFQNFILKNVDYIIEDYEIAETYIKKGRSYVKTFLEVRDKVYVENQNLLLNNNKMASSWISTPNDNIVLDKTVYFSLKKTGNYWKIIAKDVALFRDEEELKSVYGTDDTDGTDDNSQHLSITTNTQDSTNLFTYPHRFYNDGKNIVFNQILFEYGKKTINIEYFPVLEGLSDFLNRNSYYDIILIGHTDIDGREEFNLKLSRERAESIAAFLVNKKVEKNRIEIIAKGKKESIKRKDANLQKLDRKVLVLLKEKTH